MNELIFVSTLLISLFSILCVYKIFANKGLSVLLMVLILLNFVLSFKITTVFSFDVNISVITYGAIYNILFLLQIKCNAKERKKIISLSILTTIFMILFTILACLYVQTVDDNTAINMNNLFLSNYRIIIIYPILFIIEQLSWIKMYEKSYPKYNSIFITMIVNAIILGFIFTVAFCLFSYFTVLSIKHIVNIILTIYLFKLLIILINLPLLYFLTKKVKK